MRSDPDLGALLRADLDASAAHGAGVDYDVDKGLARHLALVAGVGAAAATTTAAATATASTSSVASAAAAAASTAPAAATAATAATATTGIAAAFGVKTMIAIAAIGVVSATGGVIAVTRGSSNPEPKPAVVTVTQPRSNPQDLVPSSPRATVEGTLETAPTPTITPDDLPQSTDGVKPAVIPAPAVSATKIETDNYARARALAATDPAGALAIVEADNKKFAHGVFAEEREALAIDCLVRTGRKAEAQERGKAFLVAHPTSTFAEKIRSQIDSR